MNIPLTPVILSIFQIFGMFAIGAAAMHFKYFKKDDLNTLPRFIVDWLLPILAFYSITFHFEVEKVKFFWPLPFIGFGIMAIGGITGIFLKYGLKTKDTDIIKTFHHFCAINNWGYLPMIIIQNVLGEKTLALLFIMNLGSQIAFWTIGIGILNGTESKNRIKNILTPSIIAILIALFLSFSGLRNYLPQIVYKITGYAGSIAVPLMLIFIGASMYETKFSFSFRDMFYLCFVRLILIPAITIIILKTLPLSNEVYNVALIVSLMPVAVSATVLTRRYGGSPAFAGQAAIITTLVSLITIPIGLKLFG